MNERPSELLLNTNKRTNNQTVQQCVWKQNLRGCSGLFADSANDFSQCPLPRYGEPWPFLPLLDYPLVDGQIRGLIAWGQARHRQQPSAVFSYRDILQIEIISSLVNGITAVGTFWGYYILTILLDRS